MSTSKESNSSNNIMSIASIHPLCVWFNLSCLMCRDFDNSSTSRIPVHPQHGMYGPPKTQSPTMLKALHNHHRQKRLSRAFERRASSSLLGAEYPQRIPICVLDLWIPAQVSFAGNKIELRERFKAHRYQRGSASQAAADKTQLWI